GKHHSSGSGSDGIRKNGPRGTAQRGATPDKDIRQIRRKYERQQINENFTLLSCICKNIAKPLL
ncbi:hypothetical protein, partial [Loktanella salsilacus]|uniref:hypothetical protein n=1 Tax=Loktanella salsilacus TaxID=195913 RepID=UPI0030016C13